VQVACHMTTDLPNLEGSSKSRRAQVTPNLVRLGPHSGGWMLPEVQVGKLPIPPQPCAEVQRNTTIKAQATRDLPYSEVTPTPTRPASNVHADPLFRSPDFELVLSEVHLHKHLSTSRNPHLHHLRMLAASLSLEFWPVTPVTNFQTWKERRISTCTLVRRLEDSSSFASRRKCSLSEATSSYNHSTPPRREEVILYDSLLSLHGKWYP